MRVMIVDDNKIALTMLRFALTAGGFEVATAVNGKLALEGLRAGGISLVISDWEMPEMNGLELCRAIRADAALCKTYFILFSGNNSPAHRDEGRAAGVDEFLPKPFEPAQLLTRVRAVQTTLATQAAAPGPGAP